MTSSDQTIERNNDGWIKTASSHAQQQQHLDFYTAHDPEIREGMSESCRGEELREGLITEETFQNVEEGFSQRSITRFYEGWTVEHKSRPHFSFLLLK